ncbi:MAG: hypothetical protein SFT92_07215 [Rickettsiales bacterium]|nr:hypothetical protein [Rickettsiales bacterium]
MVKHPGIEDLANVPVSTIVDGKSTDLVAGAGKGMWRALVKMSSTGFGIGLLVGAAAIIGAPALAFGLGQLTGVLEAAWGIPTLGEAIMGGLGFGFNFLLSGPGLLMAGMSATAGGVVGAMVGQNKVSTELARSEAKRLELQRQLAVQPPQPELQPPVLVQPPEPLPPAPQPVAAAPAPVAPEPTPAAEPKIVLPPAVTIAAPPSEPIKQETNVSIVNANTNQTIDASQTTINQETVAPAIRQIIEERAPAAPEMSHVARESKRRADIQFSPTPGVG